MHILTLLMIHYLCSLTIVLSSPAQSSLHISTGKKQTHTCQLSAFSMPAPERLTVTADSNYTPIDGFTLKSLLGPTDNPQSPTTYYSFTCLDNCSIFSLPPFSLSADDPSYFTEKTEVFRWEHICLLTTSPSLSASVLALSPLLLLWGNGHAPLKPIPSHLFRNMVPAILCSLPCTIKASLSTESFLAKYMILFLPYWNTHTHTHFWAHICPFYFRTLKQISGGQGTSVFCSLSPHRCPPTPVRPPLSGDLLDASPLYAAMSYLLWDLQRRNLGDVTHGPLTKKS